MFISFPLSFSSSISLELHVDSASKNERRSITSAIDVPHASSLPMICNVMLSNSGLFIDDDLPELYSCLIPNSSGFTSASLHMVPPYRDLVSERLCGFERASGFRRVSRSRTLLNFASPSLLSKSIVADAKNDIGLLINYSVAKPAQHSFSFLLFLSISFRLFVPDPNLQQPCSPELPQRYAIALVF